MISFEGIKEEHGLFVSKSDVGYVKSERIIVFPSPTTTFVFMLGPRINWFHGCFSNVRLGPPAE